MARYWNDKAEEQMASDDLEPYRRLVELQRQMIELAQQHEQSKRRRDALREQMERETVARRQYHHGWRRHLQQSATRLLKYIPGFVAAKSNPGTVNHKQSLSC